MNIVALIAIFLMSLVLSKKILKPKEKVKSLVEIHSERLETHFKYLLSLGDSVNNLYSLALESVKDMKEMKEKIKVTQDVINNDLILNPSEAKLQEDLDKLGDRIYQLEVAVKSFSDVLFPKQDSLKLETKKSTKKKK